MVGALIGSGLKAGGGDIVRSGVGDGGGALRWWT
jgi:hypothetical protein